MDKEIELKLLREKFIELNIEFTRQVNSGRSMLDLQDINSEIGAVLAEMQALEREIKGGS